MPSRENLMNYSLDSVPISEIDHHNTEFQISTDPDISNLAASIASVGLLVSPILRKTDAGFVIVSGFRRIAACQALNQTHVSGKVLSAASTRLDCVGMAVAENALQRPLNLIERSRALSLLSPHFANLSELSQASVKFGIPENPAMIRKLLPLCRLSQEIQAGILDGTLSVAMAHELERFDPETRDALAGLLLSLKMSLNKQREVLTMIEEISLREGGSMTGLLREPFLASILADQQRDRNMKTEQLREFLKKRRYPAIHAAEEKASTLIKALKFTEQMKLTPPKNLEGMEFSLMIRFRDASELKRLHQSLGDILDRPELDQLLSKEF